MSFVGLSVTMVGAFMRFLITSKSALLSFIERLMRQCVKLDSVAFASRQNCRLMVRNPWRFLARVLANRRPIFRQ